MIETAQQAREAQKRIADLQNSGYVTQPDADEIWRLEIEIKLWEMNAEIERLKKFEPPDFLIDRNDWRITEGSDVAKGDQ